MYCTVPLYSASNRADDSVNGFTFSNCDTTQLCACLRRVLVPWLVCLHSVRRTCGQVDEGAPAGRMHALARLQTLRCVLLLLLAWPAASWISVSQAKYGAQLDDLAKATYGTSRASAFRTLGWLWTFPRDPLDTRGLGGSITWALDPSMCAHLMPRMREGYWTQTFVGCPMIKASIQRALDAWAINHHFISFTDVSAQCDEEAARGGGGLAAMGAPAWDNAFAPPLRTSCSHAELYVTARANQSEPFSDGYDRDGGDAVAEAIAYPRLSNTFRFTNGETPYLVFGQTQLARQVVEVTGGRIELDASPGTCYYLDHRFCAPFNAMKRATSPGAALFGGFVTFFLVWGVLMAFVVLELFWQLGKRIRRRWLDLRHMKETRAVTLEGENLYWRTQICLGAAASWSVAGTTLRLFWVAAPWAFYQFILQNCWECYDFEAAVAHQMGHLLGLSHPDVPPQKLLGVGGVPPSNNSYNAHLAAGGIMNANNSHCTHVWDDVVAGTPPGLTGSELIYTEGGKCDPGPCGLVRTALMARYTASHSTSGGCLEQDDYEGLLTLYPVCTSGGVPTSPTCLDTPNNLGMLMVLTGLLAPLLLSMVSAFLFQMAIRARLRSLSEQTNRGLGTQATSLVCRINTQGSGNGLSLTSSSTPSAGVAPPGGGMASLLGGGGGGGGGSRASRFIAMSKRTQAIAPAPETASTALVQATISEEQSDEQSGGQSGEQSGGQHEAAAGAVPTGGRTRETAGQRYAAPPAQD